MSCESCQALQPVVACLTNLNIGTTTHLSTDLKVYAQNIAAGKITVFDRTSTAAGRFDISGFDWMPNVEFKVWATLATAESIDDTITITLDATTTMVAAHSHRVRFDSTSARETVSEQTLVNMILAVTIALAIVVFFGH